MGLTPILQQAQSLPTIMSLDEELLIIQSLYDIPTALLLREFDLLRQTLDIIYESHTGGGIFEVTDDSYDLLSRFSQKLRTLAGLVPTQQSEYLLSIALALEARF